MVIRYVAYNWVGQKVTGVLETDSEDDAYEQLEGEDLIPYRLQPVRRRRTLVQLIPTLFKPKPKEIVDFSRQLSALLNSGIPLRRALIVLRDEARGKGLKEALSQVIQDIESGMPISEAFARQPSVFPSFYIRLLKVGEATGGITFTLQRLGETLEKTPCGKR